MFYESITFLVTLFVNSVSQTVTLTPRSPVEIVNNASNIFTCNITVQQNWRSTTFYDYKMPLLGLVVMYNTGTSCAITPYDNSSYGTTCDSSTGIFTLTIKSVLVAYDKTSIRCEAIYGTGNTATDVRVQDSVVISVQVAPKYGPGITQSPQGPISDGKAVLLTCEVIGGNPLAYLSWQCQDSSVIQPTGSPPTDKTTSSIQLIVNSLFNGRTCICTAKHVLWDVPKTENHKLEVYFSPSTGPVITQSPQGPINEGRTVVLTCEVTGGNPLASLSWQCNHSSVIQSTESPPTDKATSSVQLIANRLLNGNACTCAAQHVVWIVQESKMHRLVVYFAPPYGPMITQSPPGPINEGNKLILTCEVIGGNPLANLSWQCQDSTLIQPTGSPPTDKATSSLELAGTPLLNGVTCICTAMHPLWIVSRTKNQTLVFYYAPDTNLSIQQTPIGAIVTGNIVTLTCTVSGGNPLATLSWNCTGSTTNNTSGNIASYSVELTVDNAYNNIICTCSGTHPVPSYRPTAHHRFVVYYSPDTSLTIQQTPAGAIFTGNTVVLTCTVSGGNPLAILSWNCSGYTTNNTSGNIASYSVELTMDKTYNSRICTCSGTHPVTSYRPNIQHRLNVYYPPETAPSVQQTPTGAIITGYNVTLTCTVSGGNPLPTLSWNCTSFTTNNTFKDTASYSVELTVDNTYNGRICTCSGTHLVTSYRPIVHHRLVINYGPSEVRISPATPSYTVKEKEGSVGPINCLADCNPACVITWFGPHLSADMPMLYLQGINKSQAGYYQCAASNAISSVLSAIVEIVVEWGPILNEEVLSSPQIISLNIGMMLNLTISVTANPVPSIQWRFQYNSLIRNITEISNSSTNGFQHKSSVIISTIDATHFGTYTVIISNSIGYLNRTFSVIERDKPTLPKFVHAICKTTAATILWQSSHNGGTEQFFKVQFWKSGESTRTTLEQNISDPGFEFFQQYTVSDLSSDTSYWFTVLSMNEIGFSSSKTVNCTTDTVGHNIESSQERSELFVAGISTLILTIIIVVVFTIGCCLYRKETKITRSSNYVDLTINHGSDDAYATVQETNMGPPKKDVVYANMTV